MTIVLLIIEKYDLIEEKFSKRSSDLLSTFSLPLNRIHFGLNHWEMFFIEKNNLLLFVQKYIERLKKIKWINCTKNMTQNQTLVIKK